MDIMLSHLEERIAAARNGNLYWRVVGQFSLGSMVIRSMDCTMMYGVKLVSGVLFGECGASA